jgi:hypothetical protein
MNLQSLNSAIAKAHRNVSLVVVNGVTFFEMKKIDGSVLRQFASFMSLGAYTRQEWMKMVAEFASNKA